MKDITVNNSGFVNFDKKNWSYTGDKATWIKIMDDEIIIKVASKGIISSEYTEELSSFCSLFGVDFKKISCGDTVKIKSDKIKDYIK